MHNKKHSVKRYVAIMTVIVVLVIQCIGLNASVVISNAESKNASTTDDAKATAEVEEELNGDSTDGISDNNFMNWDHDTSNSTNDETSDGDNNIPEGDSNNDIANGNSDEELSNEELEEISSQADEADAENNEDELVDYIKTFDIQDLDGNSIINDGAVFNRYQAIKLVYDFEIPKNTRAKDFTMTIDDCILIKEKMTADLIIDNEKIGEAIFDTDHTVCIKFTDNVFTSDLKGKFYIQTYFDQEVLGDIDTSHTIKFTVGGVIIAEIPVNFEDTPQDDSINSVIVKDKIYDSSTQTITWKIYVAPNGADLSQAKIIDKLQPHQEFVENSVEIYDFSDKDRVGEKLSYRYTTSTRVLSINDLSFIDQWITISFKTKVDPGFLSNQDGEKVIKNVASFRLADDENKVKYSNEVDVNLVPNMITKYGEWNRLERKIDWTIKVNNQTISKEDDSKLKLNNCVVTDILPDCLELDYDKGIYLDGQKLISGKYTYDSSTNLTAKRDGVEFFPDKGSYTYQYVSEDKDKCGKLKIELGDIDDTHEIKFSTDIKNELYQRNFWSFVVNEISLSTDGDDYGAFEGVYTYMSNPVYIVMTPISKMALETSTDHIENGNGVLELPYAYNPQDHRITWQLSVNPDGLPMENALVADKLQNGLMFTGNVSVVKFLPYDELYNPKCDKWDYRFIVRNDGSLRYYWLNDDYYGVGKPGGVWIPPDNEFNFSYDEASNEVKFKINNYFDSLYVICFDTKIVDPEIYASNGDIKLPNTARIRINNSPDEVSSDTWITNGRLTKSEMIKLSAVDYDCISHKIKWSGIVNKNKLLIKKGNIFDEIENNQKYVDGTFKIEKYNLTAESGNGQIIYDDSLKNSDGQCTNSDKFSHIEAQNNQKESLNYYLGDDASDETYLVTFETEVTDESIFKSNEDKPVKNKITLKDAVDAKGYVNDRLSQTDISLPEVSDIAETNVKSSVIQKEGVFHPETETIDWSIAANINRINLENAIIKDEFQEGLDLYTDTINIYPMIINSDGSYNVSEEPISSDLYEIEDYNPDEHHNDGNYVSDKRILHVKFKNSIQDAYMLKFTTKADINHAPFYNTAYFEGVDENNNHNNDPSNQVKIPGIVGSVGADVQKEEGSISAYVVDNEENELSGANFRIYYGGDGENYNSDNEILKDEGCVDSNTGMVKFKKLSYGWYKIVETKAPNGYKLSDNMEDRIKYIRVISQENLKFIFKHIKIEENQAGQIKLLKTDEYGNPLENARYMLKASDGTEQDIQSSDDDGILLFDNIPFGIYSIDEVQAPDGYKLDSDPNELKNIIVAENSKNIDLTVHNDIITEPPIRGSIKITKADEEDTNKTLEGAEFNLYSSGDYENVLNTKISDSNGSIVFDDLPEGIYDIKEISAPDGYEISKVIYKAIVVSSDRGKSVNMVITNKKKQSEDNNDINNDNDIDKTQDSNSGGTSSGVIADGYFDDEEEYYEAIYSIGQDESMIKLWNDKNEIQRFDQYDSDSSEKSDISDDDINISNNDNILPQAGKFVDTKVMILIGLIFIGLGIYPSVKRIHKNSK